MHVITEAELLKREASFCTFRPLNILMCTWNLDDARPDMLTGIENTSFFETHLQSMESPDIVIFGFQEVINLEDHKLTASALLLFLYTCDLLTRTLHVESVLLGPSKKRADGQISEKVSKHYRLWHDRLVLEIQRAIPREGYIVQHTENLVGLFTCVFVRKALIPSLKDVAITTVKRGMNGRYGNKGAIVARFVVEDSSICFINCHLAAGQGHKRARNRDLGAILEEKSVFSASGNTLGYVGGGDGSMILDHEVCFVRRLNQAALRKTLKTNALVVERGLELPYRPATRSSRIQHQVRRDLLSTPTRPTPKGDDYKPRFPSPILHRTPNHLCPNIQI